jgi:hypothetical protein
LSFWWKEENDVPTVRGIITIIVLLTMLGMGLAWAVQGNDFFLYRTFAPKQEAVRRRVFEQSKAFNQGMIQELQNMQFEYERTDKEHQAALADIILHRAADFDLNQPQVPQDLRSFIEELRRERAEPSP